MTGSGGSDRRRRRLAAILMADVVGFSRMMGRDEEGTTARIVAFHERARSTVESHGGRVVGTAGDSVFGDFDSIVAALDCAVEIQADLHADNQERSPDDRLEARIGLHIGDVIVEEYTVFGDGVNIASRLEQLADPGGIALSEAVYDQVKGSRDLPFRELGARELKNIDHPVRVYQLDSTALSGEGSPGRYRSSPASGFLNRYRWWLGIAAVLAAAGVVTVIALTGGGEPASTTSSPAAPTTTPDPDPGLPPDETQLEGSVVVFEGTRAGWQITGSGGQPATGGPVVLNGTPDWTLMTRDEPMAGNGVLIRFSVTGPTYRMAFNLENGVYDSDGERRWGTGLGSEAGDFYLYIVEGLEPTGESLTATLEPNQSYFLLVRHDGSGHYSSRLRAERGGSLLVLERDMGAEWADIPWFFVIGVQEGDLVLEGYWELDSSRAG